MALEKLGKENAIRELVRKRRAPAPQWAQLGARLHAFLRSDSESSRAADRGTLDMFGASMTSENRLKRGGFLTRFEVQVFSIRFGTECRRVKTAFPRSCSDWF